MSSKPLDVKILSDSELLKLYAEFAVNTAESRMNDDEIKIRIEITTEILCRMQERHNWHGEY